MVGWGHPLTSLKVILSLETSENSPTPGKKHDQIYPSIAYEIHVVGAGGGGVQNHVLGD